MLVAAAEAKAAAGLPLPTPLRYDIVNTGREVLAKASNTLFNASQAATTSAGLAAAMVPMLAVLAEVQLPPREALRRGEGARRGHLVYRAGVVTR